MTAAFEKQLFTYADYKGWEFAEGERYEIIHGEAFAMAGPNDSHQAVSGEIFRQIANFLHGKPCKELSRNKIWTVPQARSAPYDVRLFYDGNENDDTVVQPDISVICDDKKRGKEGCRGAPDLVLEVISPSNTAVEMTRKFNLYREAGVREYWVVDPQSKTAQRHIFDAGGSIQTRVYGSREKAPVEILPGLEIDLEQAFTE